MYDVYLDTQRLPVTPQSIIVKINNQNSKISLLSGSQINVLQKPGLSSISFSALIPRREYPFSLYTDGFNDVSFYIDMLENFKESAEPFWLTISRDSENEDVEFSHTDVEVVLEDYVIREEASNGTDVMVDINLSEYAGGGTKKIKREKVVSKKKKRSTQDKPVLETYTVVPGDYLWLIAERTLGDGRRYPEIYQLNKERIDERNKGTGLHHYTIYAGQVFVLPMKN